MKNKIQLFRKQSGLSQSQLAQKVGISEISIRKYENNERKPKIETLVKIASALNITLSDLLDTPTVAIPDNWITLLLEILHMKFYYLQKKKSFNHA